MANSVFLDTNGWLALLNSTDELHGTADRVWRELGENGLHIVLSDWIIAETGNGLARSRVKNRFADAVRLIVDSPRVDLVWGTPELLDQALVLYEQHHDKLWGLVDCLSFVVMERNKIAESFSSDRHFEQAGFKCLLPNK